MRYQSPYGSRVLYAYRRPIGPPTFPNPPRKFIAALARPIVNAISPRFFRALFRATGISSGAGKRALLRGRERPREAEALIVPKITPGTNVRYTVTRASLRDRGALGCTVETREENEESRPSLEG